jgi:hypothetical protein
MDAAACRTCGSADQRRFCPDCGQPRWRGRYGLRRALAESLQTILDADSRSLRTVRDLTICPGRLAWDVLRGRTEPYVLPFRYLVVVAALVTVVSLWTGVTDAERQYEQLARMGMPAEPGALSEVNGLLQRWFNVYLVGVAPFMALASWALFRRWKLHYAEHLVLNAYVAAHQSLLFLPFVPVLAWGSPGAAAVAGLVYLVASLGYAVFALAVFFGGDWLVTGGLAVLAVGLSTFVYFGLVIGGIAAFVVLRG